MQNWSSKDDPREESLDSDSRQKDSVDQSGPSLVRSLEVNRDPKAKPEKRCNSVKKEYTPPQPANNAQPKYFHFENSQSRNKSPIITSKPSQDGQKSKQPARPFDLGQNPESDESKSEKLNLVDIQSVESKDNLLKDEIRRLRSFEADGQLTERGMNQYGFMKHSQSKDMMTEPLVSFPIVIKEPVTLFVNDEDQDQDSSGDTDHGGYMEKSGFDVDPFAPTSGLAGGKKQGILDIYMQNPSENFSAGSYTPKKEQFQREEEEAARIYTDDEEGFGGYSTESEGHEMRESRPDMADLDEEFRSDHSDLGTPTRINRSSNLLQPEQDMSQDPSPMKTNEEVTPQPSPSPHEFGVEKGDSIDSEDVGPIMAQDWGSKRDSDHNLIDNLSSLFPRTVGQTPQTMPRGSDQESQRISVPGLWDPERGSGSSLRGIRSNRVPVDFSFQNGNGLSPARSNASDQKSDSEHDQLSPFGRAENSKEANEPARNRIDLGNMTNRVSESGRGLALPEIEEEADKPQSENTQSELRNIQTEPASEHDFQAPHPGPNENDRELESKPPTVPKRRSQYLTTLDEIREGKPPTAITLSFNEVGFSGASWKRTEQSDLVFEDYSVDEIDSKIRDIREIAKKQEEHQSAANPTDGEPLVQRNPALPQSFKKLNHWEVPKTSQTETQSSNLERFKSERQSRTNFEKPHNKDKQQYSSSGNIKFPGSGRKSSEQKSDTQIEEPEKEPEKPLLNNLEYPGNKKDCQAILFENFTEDQNFSEEEDEDLMEEQNNSQNSFKNKIYFENNDYHTRLGDAPAPDLEEKSIHQESESPKKQNLDYYYTERASFQDSDQKSPAKELFENQPNIRKVESQSGWRSESGHKSENIPKFTEEKNWEMDNDTSKKENLDEQVKNHQISHFPDNATAQENYFDKDSNDPGSDISQRDIDKDESFDSQNHRPEFTEINFERDSDPKNGEIKLQHPKIIENEDQSHESKSHKSSPWSDAEKMINENSFQSRQSKQSKNSHVSKPSNKFGMLEILTRNSEEAQPKSSKNNTISSDFRQNFVNLQSQVGTGTIGEPGESQLQFRDHSDASNLSSFWKGNKEIDDFQRNTGDKKSFFRREKMASVGEPRRDKGSETELNGRDIIQMLKQNDPNGQILSKLMNEFGLKKEDEDTPQTGKQEVHQMTPEWTPRQRLVHDPNKQLGRISLQNQRPHDVLLNPFLRDQHPESSPEQIQTRANAHTFPNIHDIHNHILSNPKNRQNFTLNANSIISNQSKNPKNIFIRSETQQGVSSNTSRSNTLKSTGKSGKEAFSLGPKSLISDDRSKQFILDSRGFERDYKADYILSRNFEGELTEKNTHVSGRSEKSYGQLRAEIQNLKTKTSSIDGATRDSSLGISEMQPFEFLGRAKRGYLKNALPPKHSVESTESKSDYKEVVLSYIMESSKQRAIIKSYQEQNEKLKNLLHQKNSLLDELSHGFVRTFIQSPHLKDHFSSPVFSSFFRSFSIDGLLEEVFDKNPKTKSLFSKKNKPKIQIEIMSRGSKAGGAEISLKTDGGSGAIVDNFDVMSSGDVGVSRKKVEFESELSAAGFSEAFNSKKSNLGLSPVFINV